VSWRSGIIGNNRDPISPDFSQFFPIILNQEKLGVIGSVESQFLESQLFCKFPAKCQIPDFLRSVPGWRWQCQHGYHWHNYLMSQFVLFMNIVISHLWAFGMAINFWMDGELPIKHPTASKKWRTQLSIGSIAITQQQCLFSIDEAHSFPLRHLISKLRKQWGHNCWWLFVNRRAFSFRFAQRQMSDRL
jgi:hypothetical protein